MIRISTYLFISICIISCTNAAEEKAKPDNNNQKKETENIQEKPVENIEDKVISLIDSLPEVVNLGKEIEENSKGKNHLTLWVSANPQETKIKYYWVKVGEDNGDNIVTLQNYYVDPKNEEILFYDIIKDTLIQLQELRMTEVIK